MKEVLPPYMQLKQLTANDFYGNNFIPFLSFNIT